MKILVVYYSRTGTTKIVAEKLAKKLNADLEAVVDQQNRQGMLNWIIAGFHAASKKTTQINQLQSDLQNYDLVIIGTPIWVGSVTPAIRTFFNKNQEAIKKSAFFTVSGGTDTQKCLDQLSELASTKPLACFSVTEKQVKSNKHLPLVTEFAAKIKSLA
jgi:flavodoxin